MPTYYDAWLTYCHENNIALPERECDKAWEFLKWMCRENSYALRKFIPTPAPNAEPKIIGYSLGHGMGEPVYGCTSDKPDPQEIDGLSAGGRLLGLSGKAHVDTGKVRVAKSARSNPQNQSEVCERECSECPTPEEDCEKCMADCIKHFEKQDDGLDRSDEIHITPTKGRILKSKLKMKQGELCGACRGTREIRSSEYRSSCPVCHGIGKLNEQRDKNEK